MLHHWFHVDAKGEWRTAVAEHIDALDQTGLDEALSTLYVGVVGRDDEVDACLEYMASRIDFHLAAVAPRGWHDVTLEPMRLVARTLGSDDTILFAHTHGSMRSTANARRALQYWNIGHWQRMQTALVVADTAGASWVTPTYSTHGYWSGNTWWAQAKYIATLEAVPTRTFGPETWIGSGARTIFDAAPGQLDIPLTLQPVDTKATVLTDNSR